MAGVHGSPLRSLLLLERGADNGILDFTSLNETGFQSSDPATCKFLRIFRDTSKEGEKTREFFFFFFRKTSAAADAREREFCWIYSTPQLCAKLLLLV